MLILTALAASSLALAADPEFAGTDAPAQKFDKPETQLSAEAGFALAGGNAEYWLLNAGLKGSQRWQRNKLSLVLGANLGRSRVDTNADGLLGPVDTDGDGTIDFNERDQDMVESARKYAGELRYDRYIGDKNSLYVLVGAFVDPFSGYDLRSHEQVGYSRTLVENDDTNLLVEIGLDYAQENYVAELAADPDPQSIIAGRLMLGLTHEFNENVQFADTVEVYENILDTRDLRVLNTASISAKLSDVFSLKLGHSLIFDNVPAGFDPDTETYGDSELRRLDQLTTANLVASIF